MKFVFAAFVIILLNILPLFAQGVGETTGTLTGNAQDATGGPLPGVLITVSGTSGTKTTTSDSDGKFIFPFLIPGIYSIKAELQGFSSIEQEEVPVRLDQRTELSLRMKPALQESIEVIDEVPLLDLTSTTTGANISDQLINNIPLGRSFTSIINLAPGVSDAGVGGNLSISGASGLENTYIVDGVNITDPGYGAIGAYSVTYGSLGSGFPPDMVKEVQVKTGGFEPEYGEALGGVVNVITRTGGNEFVGEAYVYFSPEALEGSRKRVDFEQTFVTNIGEVKSVDGGLNIAGPIIANKLFFFGAYNPRRVETTHLNDPDSSQFSEFPEGSNVRTTHSYAAKLTANLSNNHTLEFSAFGDPSTSELANQNGQGLASRNPLIQQSELEYGSNSQVGRWTGILRSNMFVEAQIARSHNEFQEILGPLGDQNRVIDRTSFPFVESGGIGGFDAGSIGTNLQYSLKLTNLWGGHEVRYGIQFEDISYLGGRDISGPPLTAFNGEQTSTGAVVIILPNRFGLEKVYLVAITSLFSSHNPTTTNYVNWFAQDSWNITPSLNLKFGVRWERQQIKGDREGSEDITLTNNWAPRLGATYDYLHNGKSKAFFHYGRFFEKIPNALAALGLSSSRLVLGSFYSNSALTQLIPGTGFIVDSEGVEVEGLGRSTSPYKTRAQYSDEWIGGLEQEVARDLSLGARFIYRRVGRVLEDVLVNLDAPCIKLPDGRCVPPAMRVEDNVVNSNSLFFVTNLDGHYPGFPDLSRQYKALEITADKRFSSRWQVLASYRYAQLVGNYEGLFRRDNGQSAPHLTSIDFAESPYLGFTYEEGPLPNDIRHAIKLHGSYEWDMGLNTGLSFNFSSGRPITDLGAIPRYGDNERLLTPRGALGRTDNIVTLDLHADYGIAIGQQRIAVGLDIFNIFNNQGAVAVVQSSEIDNATFEPTPRIDFLKPSLYQDPRIIRFVLRYSF